MPEDVQKNFLTHITLVTFCGIDYVTGFLVKVWRKWRVSLALNMHPVRLEYFLIFFFSKVKSFHKLKTLFNEYSHKVDVAHPLL